MMIVKSAMKRTEEIEGCRVTVTAEDQGSDLVEVTFLITPHAREWFVEKVKRPALSRSGHFRPNDGPRLTDAEALEIGMGMAKAEIGWRRRI